jgi:hypothetical protein
VQEQWLLARESMTGCAAETCPLALRVDCQDWLEELSRVLPSLLIVIEREENDSSPVRLELDGRELHLPEPLGPIEALPGKHHLHATLAGHEPIDIDLTLAKGEKNRVVHVRFPRSAPAAAVTAPARSPLEITKTPEPSNPRRPVPAATYWLSGGALAAFATSGVLLGSALHSLSSAREKCAPNCRESTKDSIDRRLLAADIVGGLGFALGGAALYTFFARPTEQSSSSPAARLMLAPGYAAVSLEQRF